MEAKLEQPLPFSLGNMIKVIIGAFLVVVGLLLTLTNLEIVNAIPVLRFWPLVLVAIGLIKVLARSGTVFGVVLMIFGAWITAANMGLVRFTIFGLWPLLLILGGVVLVGRAFGRWPPSGSRDNQNAAGAYAVLSSRNIVERSRDYTGGEMVAFLGGCHLDLTRAAMTRRPAVLDVTAILGGMEILVPDDWEVSGEVVPVMGGFELKSDSAVTASAGELVIRGTAFLGGIEVKSVRRTS